MRLFGLIDFYVVESFLTAFLILKREHKDYGLRNHFHLCFRFNQKSQIIVSLCEFIETDAMITRGLIHTWVYQPLGLVKYNSISLLDFFDYEV